MKNIHKIVLFIVFSVGFLIGVLLLMPSIRQIMIQLTEHILGRQLQNHDKWHNHLFVLSKFSVFLFGLLLFYLAGIFKQLGFDISKFYFQCKEQLKIINLKKLLIPIVVMFGIYILGIFTIIRVNFLYADDLDRAIHGNRGWSTWSRYVSDFFAVFIHADTSINDISPLTQLIAAFFMAAAGVLLVYIILDGKITKTACFASLPIGLSPYFLECFSYKFDSPYMALSVFASIVPFLFKNNYLLFAVSSIIMLLIMCTTYQAASGIYIIITIFLAFLFWIKKEKSGKEIIRFIIFSAASYSFSMIFFRVILMIGDNGNYASTEIHSFDSLFIGITGNIKHYYNLINDDFSFIWKIFLILLCIAYIFHSLKTTKRNKLVVFIASLIVIILMSFMSYGSYLFLQRPLFAPRAMFGFGVFIACIAIFVSGADRKILIIPGIALSWCFFIFSFSYGNALAEQKEYSSFREETILHDLSLIFPDKNKNKEPIPINFKNHIDFAPSVEHISVRSPVIKRLVPNMGGNSRLGNRLLTSYYNFNLVHDSSIEETGLNEILNTYYHTIKSDGKRIFVIFK